MTFCFICATTKAEGSRLPIHEFLDSVRHPDGINIRLEVAWENKESLSKVYNRYIEQ